MACKLHNYKFQFSESLRGIHPKTQWRLEEVNAIEEAKEWVRKNSQRKSSPNMAALDFKNWVNDSLLGPAGIPKILEDTARVWLLRLGFYYVHQKKGVYFDGQNVMT